MVQLKILIPLFFWSSFVAAQNASSIEVGYGLNLAYDRQLTENETSTYGYTPVLTIGYEYLINDFYGLTCNVAYAKAKAVAKDFGMVSDVDLQFLACNIGARVHMYNKKKFDISSGFYLAYTNQWRYNHVLDENFFTQSFDYSISLVKVGYNISEHVQVFAETIVGTSMLSNYYIGVKYLFPD